MAYTTIDDPEAYFQVKLWTGTGSTQSLTFDGDTDMQPDLVIAKTRNDTQDFQVIDSVRGATKLLATNGTATEFTDTNNLTSFNTDGFTVGSSGGINGSSDTLVAWCWKESADSGMDIVSYTGNGSARTISHSLSAVPHYMVHKGTTNTYNWGIYHHKLSPSDERNLNFNTDGAANVDDGGVYYNSTDPTSSVFSVGTNVGYNENTATYIAYLWSEKQGFSKFGSYVGNGSTDNSFIYLGFRPAMVLLKSTTAGTEWVLFDNKRLGYNEVENYLRPNRTNAESSGSGDEIGDILSNGFKVRRNGGDLGTSGRTFLYMAFAEAPFVNSNGVPCNAR